MELQQIIERCKQGDKQAFGQLYCDYSESLRAICLHYVPNQTVANDLLHDAFVLIITKIGDLKDTSKADVWMKTVTRNVALLYLREQSRHDDVPLTEVSDASTEPVPPISYQEIMELVEALPAGYRQVFRLSVLDGMNHQQISELLNIEPHSSSSQLFRAKKQLRRWLLPMILVLLVVLVPLSLLLWEDKEIPVSPSQQPSLADKQQENRQPEPSVLSDSVPPTQPIPSIVYKNTQVPHVQLDSICPAQPELPAQQNRQDCVPPSQPTPSLPVKVQGDAPLLAQTTEGYTGHSSAAASLWSVDLSYSGIDNKRDMQLPYANEETNDVVYDTLSHHHMPLTVTLSLNRRIGSHWQLGTGVRYMRMISDMQSGNTYASLYQHQRVQYLGIPVSVSWHERLSRQWSVYATANVALNIPLLSTLESHYVLDGTALEYCDEHLHPGLQWSSGLGLGLQYNVSPHVAFFVEPSLQHYFKNNSGVETWNTSHPCTFTVPLGLRVTF